VCGFFGREGIWSLEVKCGIPLQPNVGCKWWVILLGLINGLCDRAIGASGLFCRSMSTPAKAFAGVVWAGWFVGFGGGYCWELMGGVLFLGAGGIFLFCLR